MAVDLVDFVVAANVAKVMAVAVHVVRAAAVKLEMMAVKVSNL
jgi:hypothetical protein